MKIKFSSQKFVKIADADAFNNLSTITTVILVKPIKLLKNPKKKGKKKDVA